MSAWIVIVICLVGIIGLGKLVELPIKLIKGMLINTVVGVILFFIINAILQQSMMSVPFNSVNALIMGVLGVPGVIAVVALNYLGI